MVVQETRKEMLGRRREEAAAWVTRPQEGVF